MRRSYCMKSMTFAVTIVGLMTFAQSAHAREHHYRHGHRHHIVASRGMSAAQRSGWSADSVSVWGSAPTSGIFAFAAAGNGAVVVWPHHVGKIVGRENGQWVVQSGNDGHAVRTRARSIAGAIALR